MKKMTLGRRTRDALIVISAGVLFLIVVSSLKIGEGDRLIPRRTSPWGELAGLLAAPFYFLFGKPIYILPFVVIYIGIVLNWELFHLPRRRNILRGAMLLLLTAATLAGLDLLLSIPAADGGLVGQYYYAAWQSLCGRILRWMIGSLVMAVGAVLIYVKPESWKKALRGWRLKGRALLGQFIRREEPPREKKSPSPGKVEKLRISEEPDRAKDPSPRASPAPWLAGNDADMADSQAEMEAWESYRFDLDILPPNERGLGKRPQKEEISRLKGIIENVISRASKIELKAAGDPIVGMSMISFEFARGTRSSIPINRIAQAIKDIGLETGRAPARIVIDARISVELPLQEEERMFAPIKPLLLETMPATEEESPTYLLGRDQEGTPLQLDLDKNKHILVGGGTKGGKSLLLHTIIFGVIFRYAPKKVCLALADLKIVEFSAYRGLPHLFHDIVTNEDEFPVLAESLWAKLEARKAATARNPQTTFLFLLMVVDEFSAVYSEKLNRLIAQARAFNMLFILATQYPKADVISTKIKANLLTAIGFRTKEVNGSQLIINSSEATMLRGAGDCVVLTEGHEIRRVQAGWVTSPRDTPGSDIEAVRAAIARLRYS